MKSDLDLTMRDLKHCTEKLPVFWDWDAKAALIILVAGLLLEFAK